MTENFLEIDDLKTDREIHNEKIKLLAFKISDEIDNINQALKLFEVENTILKSYINDVQILTDIISDLTIKELQKK